MPGDYTYAKNSWGNSFYKIYEANNYGAAQAQCESDGAFLAVPRSEAENDFIAGLIPNTPLWIGINDIDQEGVFVAVDGSDITWTKWDTEQPNNINNQDAVMIGQGTIWEKIPKSWNDVDASSSRQFVCLLNITGKFTFYLT